MSSISSLTDLDDLDISDTSDIEDFNMSATGGAAAGAAILPGYRHPGIQSGFAGLSRQTLLDMHSDPARIIRTFNGSYKSMKLQPKIELLDGANNYALWCQRMICILQSLKLNQIVIDGAIPTLDATDEELNNFAMMQMDGMLLINMTVKERILQTVTFDDPHLMWRHLKALFYRDNPYNIAVHLHSFHNLHSQVDLSKPLGEHVERFEIEHTKVLNLLKNSRKSLFSTKYFELLADDEMKKNLMLSALVPHNPLLVDTLMSNDRLTYEDAKRHIINLPSSQYKEGFNHNGVSANGEKAMVVAVGKRKPNAKGTTEKVISKPSDNTSYSKPSYHCYHCKKRGHKISECRIRKKEMADKEKSSEKADGKADKKKQTALVTSAGTPNASASVPEMVRPDSNDDILLSSQTQWKIDTCATAHMCNDLDKYHEFIPNCKAIVTVGDNIPLEAIGKGTIRLYCMLPDGESHVIELFDVLFVPKLGHCLISWNALRGDCELRGVHESDDEDYLYVYQHDAVVFMAKYVDNFPYVCLASKYEALPAHHRENDHTRCVDRDHSYWHFVLAHTSVIKPQLYADGKTLPKHIEKENKALFCHICLMGKSTHVVPLSHGTVIPKKRKIEAKSDEEAKEERCRTSRPFEIIYSDLSGKAPIASLAGALYYITFIDDFSRAAWILFLQEKSAAKEAIHNFVNLIKRQFDTKIKYFFTDNGTEYVNSDVRHFFLDKGIAHNTIPAYTHEYNDMTH